MKALLVFGIIIFAVIALLFILYIMRIVYDEHFDRYD